MQITPLVCGYTTQDHLLVDLDGCSQWQAKKIAEMLIREYPIAGTCLIVQSSENHYHLVFDSWLPWEYIHKIVMILGDLGLVEKNFSMVRELRHDLTLRISPKMYLEKTSSVPLPVELLGQLEPENSYGILKYLQCLNAFISGY
jgi:hypothetical protein